MNPASRVLFITYNGLMDPLGPSQILPYVYMIREQGRQIHVLSFEKNLEHGDVGSLRLELRERGIEWTALSYTHTLGKLGKAWDLARMYGEAVKLSFNKKFTVIHCRSLHATQVGLLARHLCGAKVIFDMRGLWVDERVDGGIWHLSRPLDAVLYRFYKRVERWALASADAVVVLTENVVQEVARSVPQVRAKVSVIPCCADYAHFRVVGDDEKRSTRGALGIPEDALLLCYLGSLGTWYRLADMGRMYRSVLTSYPHAWFLFITRDWNDEHSQEFSASAGLNGERKQIVVRAATRDQVPALIGATDLMLSFIQPSYSKRASSPTKLAEAFAAGIPVISNRGVGDVESITDSFRAGAVVDLEDTSSFDVVLERLGEIMADGGEALRERTRPAFDVHRARERYAMIYQRLDNR